MKISVKQLRRVIREEVKSKKNFVADTRLSLKHENRWIDFRVDWYYDEEPPTVNSLHVINGAPPDWYAPKVLDMIVISAEMRKAWIQHKKYLDFKRPGPWTKEKD
jgi:hypothetical protein